MKSILQTDENRCFLCDRTGAADRLDWHHVFFGPYRKNSDAYGLTIRICHNRCHLQGVHKRAKMDTVVKAYAQKKAMQHYGFTTEQFIELFGKNYIDLYDEMLGGKNNG